MSVSIEVISMWYNEEFLAPLFLRHYDYVDRITVLFDLDTTDNSLALLKAAPGVNVLPFRFPDGMDDVLKQLKVNERYRACEADWALLVDADEFLFRKEGEEPVADLRPLLEAAGEAQVYAVRAFDVMRHRDDADIDRTAPALLQRRHGLKRGIKPCVARRGLDMFWQAGCHELVLNQEVNFVHDTLYFAHWAMADPCFAVERRLKNRKARQSKSNLEKGLTSHNHHVTLKDLQREFAQGLDAERLF